MNLVVVCEYGDGTEEPLESDFPTLGSAVSFALDQADRLGNAINGHHGLPSCVRVFCDQKIELTIKVFRVVFLLGEHNND